jgi:hydroxysqualene dehydroxylase
VDRDAHELARSLVTLVKGVRAGRRVAVVGAGWAGLAAAVEATQRGHAVTLFEMAAQPGGRAREVRWDGAVLDNGQHILIGAYTETLRLMRSVGLDVAQSFVRTPLRITYPEGAGLHLRAGAPALAFALAVLRYRSWPWTERLALLRAAGGWWLGGFVCDAACTVAEFTAALPARVRAELIDPLCVAALNTPSQEASASVFLRVLKDALMSGPGSADLLLPRVSLSDAFPVPAMRWLEGARATLRPAQRVDRLEREADTWRVDGEAFDQVVLATPPGEAARLTQSIAPEWSRTAAALRFEPIVTVYLRSAGCVLPAPMLALRADAQSPAQFVFDRGQLGGPEGMLAFVVSGAQAWVDSGMEATEQATLQQARDVLASHLRGPLHVLKTVTEKRATFRCTPGLQRPAALIAPGLFAAGDYVDGPYPATLEGAVRSGVAAIISAG